MEIYAHGRSEELVHQGKVRYLGCSNCAQEVATVIVGARSQDEVETNLRAQRWQLTVEERGEAAALVAST